MEAEKKVEIYEWQLRKIQNALRMASNIHNSSKKVTCFDRCVTQAKKFAENALEGKIDEQVPYM